eukprot:443781-Amphidinium_carterae.1
MRCRSGASVEHEIIFSIPLLPSVRHNRESRHEIFKATPFLQGTLFRFGQSGSCLLLGVCLASLGTS